MINPRKRAIDLHRVFQNDEVRSLARRYFIANGFDGTLTSIGVVIGAYLSGITDGFLIISIGFGAAIGLGTSGIWSVWEIERAETSRKQTEIENAMQVDLSDTVISRDLRNAQIIHSISAATGPIIGIFITLIPLLFVDTLLSIFWAVILSISLGIALLGVIGAYMGSISQQRWYVAAIRMGLAGLVVALLSLILPG